MKVKVLNKNDRVLKLKFSEVSPFFLNAVRRTIMSKVNTYAVDYIDVHENTSPLYNEILAHRIGLIPFKGDKVLKPKSECDCEEGKECNDCEIKFVLKKEGPGYVYSGDIKVVGGALEPVYKNIPITYLTEKQAVHVEGAIVLGNMDEHAKFQAAVVGYNYEADEKYNDNLDLIKKDSKDKGDMIMTIESVSGADPRDIFFDAIDILDRELEELDKLIR